MGQPDSAMVGPGRFAQLFGISRDTARATMAKWREEDETSGGPPRTWRCGKKGILRTTLGVIQRELPAARDRLLVRKIEELDKQMDALSRTNARLLADVGVLGLRVDALERGRR